MSPSIFALLTTSASDNRLSPGSVTKLWFKVGVYNNANLKNLTKSGSTVTEANYQFYLTFKHADGYMVEAITDVSPNNNQTFIYNLNFCCVCGRNENGPFFSKLISPTVGTFSNRVQFQTAAAAV